MKYSGKIIKVSIFIYLFLNIWIFPSEAFLFGDPGMNYDSSEYSYEIIYEQGYRKIHSINGNGFTIYGEGIFDSLPPKSNERIRLNYSRLYMQFYEKKSDYYSIFYRVLIPGSATKLKFEGTPYNPGSIGLGGGIQFNIPTKLNRLKFHVTTSWDWSYGWQDNIHTYLKEEFMKEPVYATERLLDQVNVTEGAIAIWSAYHITDKFNIYGGISRLRTKIYVNLGVDNTWWYLDQKDGGFFGFKYLFTKYCGLSCELHRFNENTGIIKLFYNL
jgi:hypothetical protein